MQLCITIMLGLRTTHIVLELNVGAVLYVCDVSMLDVYGYDLYILETNGVLLKI